MIVGQIIVAPSPEWIANRIADGGLVEVIADATVAPLPASPVEAAAVAPAETATVPRPRAQRKA